MRAGIHNSACLVPPLQGSGGLSWGRVSTAHAVGFLQWRADGAPARCGESGCEWRRRTGLIPRQSLVVAKELTSETQSTQRKTLGMPRHVWCRPYGAPEDFLGVGFPPLTRRAFFSGAPMALRHDAENWGARLGKVRKVSCALKFPKCRVGNEYFLQKYLLAAISRSADDYRR